jgi:hypothetical protein
VRYRAGYELASLPPKRLAILNMPQHRHRDLASSSMMPQRPNRCVRSVVSSLSRSRTANHQLVTSMADARFAIDPATSGFSWPIHNLRRAHAKAY